MKRTTTTCRSLVLLALLFPSPQSPCLSSAQEVQQQQSLIRKQTLGYPLTRTLQDNDTPDDDSIEPPVCPGSDCVQLDEVNNYTDSTGATQHSVLCYKPSYCTNTSDGGGCPLYVWLDETSHNDVLEIPDQYFLREMVSRGFVSCVAKYDDSPLSYLDGCPSYRTKAKDIFDPYQAGSLLSQLCQVGNHADCEMGLAVHGWGQGAHLAVLAADYAAVTATLQFGNGDLNGVLFVETNVTCVDSENINPRLPPPRRRSIVGEFDQFFNRPSVLDQQKNTSGYDCGDMYNCLGRFPEGCPVPNEESETAMIEQCFTSGQYFHTDCPDVCPYTSTAICGGVYTPYACPIYIPDTVTGGYIEDTGGYYIVAGQDHGFFLKTTDSINFTNTLERAEDNTLEGAEDPEDAKYEFEEEFLNPSTIWGLKQSLDWLDRTARLVRAIPSSQIPTDQIKEKISDVATTIPESEMPSGTPSEQTSTLSPASNLTRNVRGKIRQ